MPQPNLVSLAEDVLTRAKNAGLKAATAESCTGGLIAASLTAVPGSSAVFERGFVTYSNEAKTEMLGVPADLIARLGAVSREVAIAMAEGALQNSHADIAVSVTGVAGPDGGSAEKPVGLVHFAAARKGRATIAQEQRFGSIGRAGIQEASAAFALQLIGEMI